MRTDPGGSKRPGVSGEAPSAELPENFALLQVLPALEAGGVEQTTLDISEAVSSIGRRSLVASAGGRLLPDLARAGGRHFALPLASKNPLRFLANRDGLCEIIRDEGVSLVHVRSRAPAFPAIAAARRRGVPIVSTYHGVYNARSAVKRWYNAVMTRTDLVIANSEFTRAHVIAEHGVEPSKVLAIPRGVDLARFDPEAVSAARLKALRTRLGLPEPEAGALVVLLAGRLTRWKGQTLLIRALGAARRRRPDLNLRLVLAGDPQGRDAYVDELVRLIETEGVGGSVVIAGHLEDMPAAYGLCDLAVAPSLEPEAFGRSAVEPQAMGKPVLAADHGATAETVEDGVTGRRLPPGDVDAWAEALVSFSEAAAEERAAMGLRGRERARRLYGLATMQARTLAAYAEVLKGRAG